MCECRKMKLPYFDPRSQIESPTPPGYLSQARGIESAVLCLLQYCTKFKLFTLWLQQRKLSVIASKFPISIRILYGDIRKTPLILGILLRGSAKKQHYGANTSWKTIVMPSTCIYTSKWQPQERAYNSALSLFVKNRIFLFLSIAKQKSICI